MGQVCNNQNVSCQKGQYHVQTEPNESIETIPKALHIPVRNYIKSKAPERQQTLNRIQNLVKQNDDQFIVNLDDEDGIQAKEVSLVNNLDHQQQLIQENPNRNENEQRFQSFAQNQQSTQDSILISAQLVKKMFEQDLTKYANIQKQSPSKKERKVPQELESVSSNKKSLPKQTSERSEQIRGNKFFSKQNSSMTDKQVSRKSILKSQLKYSSVRSKQSSESVYSQNNQIISQSARFQEKRSLVSRKSEKSSQKKRVRFNGAEYFPKKRESVSVYK